MSVTTDDFMAQLRQQNFEPELRPNEFVVFDYEVELGKHVGEIVKLGLQVPPDWPMSPPSGPFVSPRLLPISGGITGRGRPWDAVHTANDRGLADPDGVWEYWSRPFTAWPKTDRSVKAYLRHLRTLFDEIKPAVDDGDQAQAA
jgi:hypothetical protein